jgi:hypothetical protein
MEIATLREGVVMTISRYKDGSVFRNHNFTSEEDLQETALMLSKCNEAKLVGSSEVGNWGEWR